MNTRKRFILGLLSSLVLTPTCWAQPPAVPAAPAAPANLWSFLLPNADQKNACKTCFCNSPLGKLTSGAAGPMSAMSGGLIANRCAQNAIDNDIAKKPATSSEGAAARIKKDEEDAKARREAVRFLGTVDCNYWPEAIDALKKSLRKDPNECVRFEAALALRNGCCCNKETIKALEICVTGSDKDGAPPERSDRVRAAAADALARCPMIQEDPENGGKKDDIKKTRAVDPDDFYRRVAQMPREQIVASARGVLVSLQQANKGLPSGPGGAIPPIHQPAGSLSGIVANAFSPNSAVTAPVTAKGQAKQLSLYEVVTARNGRQEYVVSAGPEYVAPASASAKMPRDAKGVVQGELRAPLPVGPPASDRPREATGYVTTEPSPVAPIVFRPARP